MAAVGLVFAPLAPLVVLAAAIVFWVSSWVYKYQLMFVFVSKVESGGVCNIPHAQNVYSSLIFSAFGMSSLTVSCFRFSLCKPLWFWVSPKLKMYPWDTFFMPFSSDWVTVQVQLFAMACYSASHFNRLCIQDIHQPSLPACVPLVHTIRGGPSRGPRTLRPCRC